MRRRAPASTGSSTVLFANPGADLYGSDRMLLESVVALRAEGHGVVVAVPADGPLLDALRAAGAQIEICPTPILRRSFKSLRGLASLMIDVGRRLGPMISVIRRVDPQVVYVNTVTAPLWLLGAWLLRRPSVCHVHEAEASTPRALLKALNLPLLLADRLIVNSQFCSDVLTTTMPRLAGRSTLVYNAVAGPTDVVAARRVLDGPVRVLYVGRLSPRKGPNVAIDSISLLRAAGIDARLDLVGAVFPGYEWFQAELDAQIAAGGLNELVTFHGFTPNVWPYIAAADVVVVPSTLEESFGNAAVEALLGARPLVVSDIAGLREASADMAAAVRVAPGDAAAIAAAVTVIVQDWTAMRGNALDDASRARDRYSADAYGRRIVAVVNSAVAGRGRPAMHGQRATASADDDAISVTDTSINRAD